MRLLLNHLLAAILISGTQIITHVKNIFVVLKDIILNDFGQYKLAFSSVIQDNQDDYMNIQCFIFEY